MVPLFHSVVFRESRLQPIKIRPPLKAVLHTYLFLLTLHSAGAFSGNNVVTQSGLSWSKVGAFLNIVVRFSDTTIDYTVVYGNSSGSLSWKILLR